MLSSIRNEKIDFLRGLSILYILFYHFSLVYSLENSILNKIIPITWMETIFNNGNYGVTIFFVISGFLITALTFERYGGLAEINLREFYAFRSFRLMPCLILSTVIVLLLNKTTFDIFKNNLPISMIVTVISLWTFWHNVLMEKVGYFNYVLNTYWVTSIEGIFYMGFPIAGILLKKTKYFVLLCGLFIIIGPIYRSVYIENRIMTLYPYFSCFDAIALGCCAALLVERLRWPNSMRSVMKCIGWLMMLAVLSYKHFMQNSVAGFSLVGLSTVILLLCAVQSTTDKPKNFITGFINWCGENSYELYLFHIIILAWMLTLVPSNSIGPYTKIVWLGMLIVFSVFVAGLMAKYFSNPINKKLRMIFIHKR